ncbi:MAG: radical SAM protein, partial [Candidatus Sumerlaeota bacterium]
MKIRSKHLRIAFRSPRNFFYAMRRMARRTHLGSIDRRFGNGWSFKPQLISINITGRCNLRCEMCMQPRGAAGDDDTTTLVRRGGEMTPEQWIRLVDQVAAAHPAFYFSGGEPLLYKGLDRILERIKQRG